MTVWKLREGLELTAAGCKVFEVIDSTEPQAATPRQGIVRTLACSEEIMKEKKKRSLSLQILVLRFFTKSLGTVYHQVYFSKLNDDPYDPPTAEEGASLP